MVDLDLQKLIEAKKEAERKQIDAAEKKKQAVAAAQEIDAQAVADWNDLITIARAEAERIGSVSGQTGIAVSALNLPRGSVVGIGYRLTRDKSALQVDIKFSRVGNAIVSDIAPTKPVPALRHIKATKQHAPGVKVDVREIFITTVRQLIEA